MAAPLIAYPVVTLIGLAGFCSRSFLGKHTHFESIPFSAVKPRFDRPAPQEAREEAERLAGILGVTVSYETAA